MRNRSNESQHHQRFSRFFFPIDHPDFIIPNQICRAKYFAGNYGAADIAPSLGSLIFSTLLAGEVYDSYATIDGNGTSTCYGSQCFKTSFVLTGVACIFVGAPFSWLLRIKILESEKSRS